MAHQQNSSPQCWRPNIVDPILTQWRQIGASLNLCTDSEVALHLIKLYKDSQSHTTAKCSSCLTPLKLICTVCQHIPPPYPCSDLSTKQQTKVEVEADISNINETETQQTAVGGNLQAHDRLLPSEPTSVQEDGSTTHLFLRSRRPDSRLYPPDLPSLQKSEGTRMANSSSPLYQLSTEHGGYGSIQLHDSSVMSQCDHRRKKETETSVLNSGDESSCMLTQVPTCKANLDINEDLTNKASVTRKRSSACKISLFEDSYSFSSTFDELEDSKKLKSSERLETVKNSERYVNLKEKNNCKKVLASKISSKVTKAKKLSTSKKASSVEKFSASRNSSVSEKPSISPEQNVSKKATTVKIPLASEKRSICTEQVISRNSSTKKQEISKELSASQKHTTLTKLSVPKDQKLSTEHIISQIGTKSSKLSQQISEQSSTSKNVAALKISPAPKQPFRTKGFSDNQNSFTNVESQSSKLSQRHVCDECGATFSRKAGLKIHTRIHTGEKPYKCEECKMCFNQKVSLIVHKRKHSGERPFVCAECGISFPLASTLKQHSRIHSGERPFGCPHCHKAFARSGDLSLHLRVHTGVKPFLCQDCGKRFSTSSDLTKHKRTHSGVKPFGCEECGKRFLFLHRLTSHMRSHTGVKPFLCTVCGAAFARASNLTVHFRLHTGDRPFECEQCGKRFSDSGNFCKHRKNSHRGLNKTGNKEGLFEGGVCERKVASVLNSQNVTVSGDGSVVSESGLASAFDSRKVTVSDSQCAFAINELRKDDGVVGESVVTVFPERF